MRNLLLAGVLAFMAGVAYGQDVVITSTTTTVVSAQAAAEQMAREGRLRHCGRSGGRREGIGFGATPESAYANCCFFQDAMRGRYRIVERGVARGPRGWYAVIRYE